MVILGVDAHKRSHTVVGVDEVGRRGRSKTCGTTTRDHLGLLKWAVKQGENRLWAVRTVDTCRGGWSGICLRLGRRSYGCRRS